MISLLLSLAMAGLPALLSEADLAPALSGPPAGAAALLEAGRPAEALAALGQATRPEARVIRAQALEAIGHSDEALRALDGLEGKLPALADRIRSSRGRILASQGRHREAVEAFALVSAGALQRHAAVLGRARSLAATGEPQAGLAALAPLLEGGGSAAALLLQGQLLASARPPDPAAARAALLECWSGRPAEPEAAACLDALRALPGEAGADPGRAALVRRAEGLLDRNRTAEVLTLLAPVVKAAPPASAEALEACRVRAAYGRALRRDRQNGKAAELLRPVAEACTDPQVRARALYVLATAVSAAGDREGAITLYRRFARQEPGSPLADDALFAASDLAVHAGRVDEGREALTALVRDLPGGDRRDEARFRLAWLSWRAGEVEAAVAALLAIEEESREADPYEHARAAYWRARLLAGRGEAGEVAARQIWAGLVAAAPADYYTLLSRARLAGAPGVALPEPAPAGPAPAPLQPGPLADDPHLAAGVALLRTGLRRAAAEELRAVDRAPLGSTAGAGPTLCLAALLDRAGDHHAAHQLLRVSAKLALRQPPDGPLRQVWEVAYPAAHQDLVRRHAPPAGVPPELLQALMREESALDPEAVSPVGAVGLTQLMLPTAKQVARKLKLPPPDRAGLMEPATSIRIGAAYLGDLLRRFDGSAALALAAYNAGENAVERWRSAAPGLPLDEFVEEIPYDETRGYVKRVLRSYASYRLLSGQAHAAQASQGSPGPAKAGRPAPVGRSSPAARPGG